MSFFNFFRRKPKPDPKPTPMKSSLAFDSPDEFGPDNFEREKDRVEDFLSWCNANLTLGEDPQGEKALVRLAALSFYVAWEAGFWDEYRKDKLPSENPCMGVVLRALKAGQVAGSTRAGLWCPE